MTSTGHRTSSRRSALVHLPTREMGQATGEALVQYLDEGKPIDSIELKGHLLERRSTARRCGRVGSVKGG